KSVVEPAALAGTETTVPVIVEPVVEPSAVADTGTTAPVEPASSSACAAAIYALAPWQCRWPLGDPAHSDFCCCGSSAIAGSSYCECHHAKARMPRPPRRGISPTAGRVATPAPVLVTVAPGRDQDAGDAPPARP